MPMTKKECIKYLRGDVWAMHIRQGHSYRYTTVTPEEDLTYALVWIFIDGEDDDSKPNT